MSNNITTNYGKVVVDTSLVPYIRENDVEFVSRNLKPYKLSKIFFDDIAVMPFCQVGNRVTLNTKKSIVFNTNNTDPYTLNDLVYQGSSNTSPIWSARLESWTSLTSTLVVNSLSGNFDETAEIFIENSSGVLYAQGNVVSVINTDTADTFSAGEGVVNPQGGNVFATVIATAGENTLYLNQNYINMNVSAVGANSFAAMTQDYKVGDIVYQTQNGSKNYYASSFRGVVEYYNNSTTPGSIAIKPIAGSVFYNSNVHMWNASNTISQPLTLNSFNNNGFFANQNVRSVITPTNMIKVANYTHKSGILANTGVTNNQSVILSVLDAGNHPTLNGNLIYFAAGSAVGTVKRVTSISGNVATLNSALQLSYSSNTYYSIGNFYVDEYGTQAGIFHIPSFPGFKFKTGNRILTITDTDRYNDPDYTMRAAATYAASGVLKTTQRLQTTPVLAPLPEVEADNLVAPVSPAERAYNAVNNKSPVTGSTGSSVPRVPLGDGLSQTFFTPKPNTNKQDNGIFVTSVDLFFKSKPNIASGNMQLPITVKIAEVLNGYPTKNYLAAKTLQAKDVKVSQLPDTNNPNTLTKFTFDDPVYLEPNQEYAIIVGSDSPEYELYVAELGEEVLGSNPPKRISEQPYAGSLFRSQNSSTWSAYQNQDLMFRINKAVFQTSGSATFNLEETPEFTVDIDRIMLTSSDLKFPTGVLNYRVTGKYTIDSSVDNGVQLDPFRTLEYGVLQDKSSKSSSSNFFNRRRISMGSADSYIVTVDMSSTDSDISPVLNYERLALQAISYNINNAGLANVLISITNRGTGYNAYSTSGTALIGSDSNALNTAAQLYRETYYANNYNIAMYAVSISGATGSGATGFAVANTNGTETVDAIVLNTSGFGYYDTPIITLPTGRKTTNTQASAIIAGETGKSSLGNIRSKYITREIVLEEGFESGDLRIYMDAIRPTGVDIQVYYKVLSADDFERISDKPWRRMEKLKDNFSKNPRSIIELQFRPSLTESQINYTENGVSYPIGGKFRSFQIKVCLTSPDPSLIPKVKNMRIIATPEG